VRLTIKQPENEDLVLDLADGSTLMDCLSAAGLSLDAPCGGKGRCGKCLVEAQGDLEPPSAKELEIIGPKSGQRLACQARGRGEVLVTLGQGAAFSALKGLGWTAPYNFNPVASLIGAPPRDRHDQRALLDTLSLKAELSPALEKLAVLEANRIEAKALCFGHQLLEVWPQGEGPEECLAAAFDLGTTGLALAVLDLGRRETILVETALNPQTAVGGDVISRITHAAEKPENLEKLQALALEGLSSLVEKALGERAENIGAAVVCGNTTMLHLLAGLNPKSLAQAPYRPIFTESLDLSALAPRLGLPSYAKVSTAPCISAYVGGDITSGLAAIKLRERPGTVIFIDIGTNGEIVLSRNGRLVATSCAAGPALEGMNISCGMRAVTGAVDSFLLVPGLTHVFSTIGGAEPKGICGSGLIDLVAELVRSGLITKTGRLKAPEGRPDPLIEGNYHLTETVFLSQKDVRQVQLAKGAISAAMKMLLAKLDLTLGDLDEVVIAGSFGYHLRAENLLAISLIPKGYQGPVSFVGNSSLAGAARLLMDRSAMEEIEKLSREIEVIELAFDPKFQETFLAELGF
jgi:uncharacterized 2Fe-2S/4Fe-4S cluster protein (DUF4445 family)